MTKVINPMPEIEGFLKELRLSGLIECLGTRNQEAIKHKLSYLEFFSTLLQDLILKRQQKRFDIRIKRAGFKMDKTLEKFDFSFNPNINRAQVLDLSTCCFVKEKVCVFIVGPCGTGKSHLAQAIGHEAVKQEIDTLFNTQSQLLSGLKSAIAIGNYEKHKKVLIKVPLLIIDDFGLKPLRSPEDEEFHDLISERYENAATILTSNLAFDEWIQAFPNQLLGMATLDRLRDRAHQIILDGKSYRRSKTEQLKLTNRGFKTEEKE